MKSEVEWPWPIRVNADSVCLGFFLLHLHCARARDERLCHSEGDAYDGAYDGAWPFAEY